MVMALCASAAIGAVRYENPVVKTDFPDPTVWRGEDGFYYAASTHQDVLKSRDLVHWVGTGHRLLEDAEYAWIAKSWPHVWAPDVVRVGDWYNLYITFHNTGAHTAVACYRSKDPAGPFTNREIVIRSEDNGRFEVIDPEVVRDPADGRLWLFFGHGDVRRVELTGDGRGQKPGAEIAHVAGIALGAPRLEPGDPRFMAQSCEGAYLHHRNGMWYLFCSIGGWGDHTYRVIVGRSNTLNGEFTDREGRRLADGYGTVILMSDKGDEFFGPGHNGEIFTLPSGRTYMFYHCHWTGLKKTDDDDSNMKVGASYIPRPLFLQEVLWDEDGWPRFGNGGKPQKDCELATGAAGGLNPVLK